MNTILYITIFIIGTLFGSFYTLAVYRIPRNIDIVKTHSFCPNCNHKLGFWELIPIFSYVILGGKCKQCKQKIRPRYLILEILSGTTFVLIAMLLKLDIDNFNVKLFTEFTFIALYLVSIFLIAGIDKEYIRIEKSVLFYAVVISVIYIIYLYIMDITSIYRYVMYLTILLILLVIDTLNLKKKAKNSYLILVLILLIIMTIFTTEITSGVTVILTLFIVLGKICIFKIKNHTSSLKRKEQTQNNFPIGFYMCISNVIGFIGLLSLIEILKI